MKSLRRQAESQAQARTSSPTAIIESEGIGDVVGEGESRPLAPARWDWGRVRRVLVVRLRSIGDTVLATPALDALRRFLPHAQIDIVLEDWVVPVLAGFDAVDNVIKVERGSARARVQVARNLR